MWLLPPVLALHNLEEAVFLPRYLPDVLSRLPIGALTSAVNPRGLQVALLIATVVPLGVSVWAAIRPSSRTALWLVLAVWATLLLNAVWHIGASVLLFRGYAPGVVTAVLLNLPLSVLALRGALREQWLTRRARWALLPGAVALHLIVLLVATFFFT